MADGERPDFEERLRSLEEQFQGLASELLRIVEDAPTTQPADPDPKLNIGVLIMNDGPVFNGPVGAFTQKGPAINLSPVTIAALEGRRGLAKARELNELEEDAFDAFEAILSRVELLEGEKASDQGLRDMIEELWVQEEVKKIKPDFFETEFAKALGEGALKVLVALIKSKVPGS